MLVNSEDSRSDGGEGLHLSDGDGVQFVWALAGGGRHVDWFRMEAFELREDKKLFDVGLCRFLHEARVARRRGIWKRVRSAADYGSGEGSGDFS